MTPQDVMQDVIQAGTVVETNDTLALVKVNTLGVISDWLPVLQTANTFKRSYTPARLKEQVLVLAGRYVIGSIFNVDCKEPAGANAHTDIMEYEDGTRIKYDTQAKTLTIKCVGDVQLSAVNADVKLSCNLEMTVAGNANIKASNAVIEADSIKVKSTDITLNNGVGVVTGGHICAFTGAPHSDCSATVKAGK